MMEKDTIETIPAAKGFHRSATFRDLARRIMPVPVERIEGPVSCHKQDVLAVEEPLQIRLNYECEGKRIEKDLAITMHTPGS